MTPRHRTPTAIADAAAMKVELVYHLSTSGSNVVVLVELLVAVTGVLNRATEATLDKSETPAVPVVFTAK
jgi:hypothetical protein